jgi:hypothetical protein
MQEEFDAVQRVLASLTEAGMDGISFKAEISAHGHATLWLFTPPPTVKPHIGFGAYPGTLVRYEGALPEPARRLPEPNPDARPHPSADPALLERVLRQRLPGTAGAAKEEFAATEARLGMPLPDELKALYRTMRAPVELREDDRDGDEDDDEPDERELTDAMLGELLFSLDGVHTGDAATRFPSWHLAREAVITPPGVAPGWLDGVTAQQVRDVLDLRSCECRGVDPAHELNGIRCGLAPLMQLVQGVKLGLASDCA